MFRWIAVAAVGAVACGHEASAPLLARDDTIPVLRPPASGLLYRTSESVTLTDPDGTGRRGLKLAFAGADLHPSSGPVVSPDGSLLAFVAPYVTPNGRASVFVADTTGIVPRFSYHACSRTAVATSWAVSIAWARAGRRLAFLCESPFGANLVIYDYTIDRQYYNIAIAPLTNSLAWSPNGRWLLVGSQIYDTAATLSATLQLPIGLTGLGWSPNNGVMVGPAGECGTGVYLTRPYAGAPLVHLLDSPYRFAEFSPDGKKLLAITSVCSVLDTSTAVILDAAKLTVERSIVGATWATWRP